LGNDTIFNSPAAYVLDPGPGFLSYLWSDGSGEQTLTVTETGLYSVTVTDNNGCQGSTAVHVTIQPSRTAELVNTGDLVLFPNPAGTAVFVRLPMTGWQEQATMTLFDAIGHQVLSTSVTTGEADTLQVDVAQLPAGTYTLTVRTAASTFVGKLAVVR
jgi:hypothetical protein